jgi:hypothetical protein
MDWSTFWATFSQTNLVTLTVKNGVGAKIRLKNWPLKMDSRLHTFSGCPSYTFEDLE